MAKKIKVSKCPRCGKSHRFVLERIVEGVYITGGFTYKKRHAKDVEKKRKQLFVCPVTKEVFEVVISPPDDEYEYAGDIVPDNN